VSPFLIQKISPE